MSVSVLRAWVQQVQDWAESNAQRASQRAGAADHLVALLGTAACLALVLGSVLAGDDCPYASAWLAAQIPVHVVLWRCRAAAGWAVLWHTVLHKVGTFRELMGLNRWERRWPRPARMSGALGTRHAHDGRLAGACMSHSARRAKNQATKRQVEREILLLQVRCCCHCRCVGDGRWGGVLRWPGVPTHARAEATASRGLILMRRPRHVWRALGSVQSSGCRDSGQAGVQGALVSPCTSSCPCLATPGRGGTPQC